jgi:site-specific DNA-methyltransferase (adenine-specific)
MNEFLNMDCMNPENGMPSFPDKYFDLAIVDPPYGLPKGSTHRRGKLKKRILNCGGLEKWDKQPSPEYFDELRRISVNQIIWGGNYFPLPPSRCIVCWDKVQPWENFSQIEIAWTSFNSPARIYKYDNRTGYKIHPTQKPIALYKWLVKNYAKVGDKLLDTHVGSASSLIAFEDMGFEYVGYELDKDYYEAAQKRLGQYRSQLKLMI